jgi:hypothetical protein
MHRGAKIKATFIKDFSRTEIRFAIQLPSDIIN